ncbi:fungal hydrophobin [Lentinula edodes]|nr:fungal hydrophobin [Lentinula edodes]
MFSRISVVAFYALFAFTILAAAIPGGKPTTTTPPVTTTVTVTAPGTTTTEPASSCSTGSLQCCDSTETAGSTAGAAILGLLGIVVQDLDVLLGITCSPITVIGLGNSGCSAQAVCCDDNAVGGLISIGCVPVVL